MDILAQNQTKFKKEIRKNKSPDPTSDHECDTVVSHTRCFLPWVDSSVLYIAVTQCVHMYLLPRLVLLHHSILCYPFQSTEDHPSALYTLDNHPTTGYTLNSLRSWFYLLVFILCVGGILPACVSVIHVHAVPMVAKRGRQIPWPANAPDFGSISVHDLNSLDLLNIRRVPGMLAFR